MDATSAEGQVHRGAGAPRPSDGPARGLFPALAIFIVFLLLLSVRAILSRAGVYAHVDDLAIGKPMVDFEKELILRGEGKLSPTPDEERSALAAAVEIAIERCLAAREARRRGLRVSDEIRAAHRRQVMERLESMGPKEEVMRTLRLTELDIATEIERDALRNMLVEQIHDSITEPTREECARFYDAHIEEFREGEAAHLLAMAVRKPDDAAGRQSARDRIEVARQEVLQGADFRTVASRMPEGPAISRGGDLGFIRKGFLPPAMEAAIEGLPDGHVSAVVETRDAYHVLQVEGRRRFEYTPFPEVWGGIKRRMYILERERQLSRLMHRLRASARIARYDQPSTRWSAGPARVKPAGRPPRAPAPSAPAP